MADVSIGTARGVVRIDYESRGASRITQEFEQIKNQTQSTATSFATWADKIGIGGNALTQFHQIQKAVSDAQRTANYFELNLANTRRNSNATILQQVQALRQAHAANKSLSDVTKVFNQATKDLPMAAARQGTLAAAALANAFDAHGLPAMQASGSKISNALSGALSMGVKTAAVAAAATAAAAAAGIGAVLTSGFSRLERIDTATHKLEALGMQTKQVKQVMKDTLEAVQGTQYSLDEAVNVAAGAVQAGVKPGNDLKAYLKDVQGLAAVTGMSLDSAGSIMNRVQTTGRLMGEDLRQLEWAGVNILPMLAKEYGVTQAAMSKMVQQGGIDAAHFNAAIRHNFSNAADIMGNSISGSIANMKTAFARLGANILAPLFNSMDGSKASPVVSAIKGIQDAVDKFSKYLSQHKKGLIEFWVDIGKAAIIGVGVVAEPIGLFVTLIADMVGVVAKGVSWLTRVFGELADLLGADGVAGNARNAANTISDFGNGLFKANSILPKLNQTLGKGWDALNTWGDNAKKATDAAEELGGATEAAAPQLISITDALGKLGVTTDDTTKAIEGTDAEWEKFIKSLQAKNAPQQVIDALNKLRDGFINGGRQAKEYSKALVQMGDSSVTAAKKSDDLIKALQQMKILPGEAEDALSSYNEEVDKLTDANANLVDILYNTGNALITQSGAIDTNDKNGRTLLKTMEEMRSKAMELAATGEYNPAEVWQQTHDSLMVVLADFGITGDAAEALINRYLLPKHTFEIQFLVKGKDKVQADLTAVQTELEAAQKQGKGEFKINVTSDPKTMAEVVNSLGLQWNSYDPLTQVATIAVPPGTDIEAAKKRIDELLNADPTTLKSEIKVITTAQDIINQINKGDPLKIPAVLDFQTGTGGMTLPTQGQEMFPGSGFTWDAKNNVWVPKGNQQRPQALPPGSTLPMPGQGDQQTPPGQLPPFAPYDNGGNPIVLQPGQTVPLRGAPGQGFPLPWNLPPLTNPQQQPNILTGQEDSARQSGQAFAEAYAQGIRERIDDVRQAALEMATASTDYLGHSPAKVGPLAGSGWTYYRGRSYSQAYAEGIASGQQAVGGASLGIAKSSSDPLTNSFAKLMSDMSQWEQFGKHIFDLVSSLTDITFNVLNLGQQLSGGKLFPKTYRRDPSKATGGSRMAPWQPGAFPNTGPSSIASNTAMVTPGKLGANPSKQEIANYIKDKALSLGYSDDQANAFVVQAVGESGLSPTASNPSGWEGIFQFDQPTWQGAGGGNMYDPQTNIDNYFNLAKQRGLTPQTMTSGTQLGTQVSIGGPWHPENAAKGHLTQAQKNAQQYLDAYRPGLPSGTRLSGNFTPQKFGLPAGTNINYGQAGFPPWIYDLAASFGIEASTYGTHQLDNGQVTGVDWRGKPEQLTAFANYLLSLNNLAIKQGIYQNPNTGFRTGILNGRPVGPDLPGTTDPGYYSRGKNDWIDHTDHFHTAFSQSVPAPGQGYNILAGDQSGQPVPVTLGPNSIDPQANPGGIQGLPPGLSDLAGDPLFQQAINAARGVSGGVLGDDQLQTTLQHLDGLIADQNALNTPEAKARANYLGQVRGQLMNQYGAVEGPTGLDQAQTLTQNISGLVGDAFGIIDSTMKSISSTKNIGDTLVRGIGNTEDIYNIIENIQSYIELGGKIAQTVSDALGMAGQIAAMSGGQDMGATSAALSAASSIAGIVAQGFQAANAVIDLGQEAWRIGTKYLGRMLEDWFGLPGASDVKYLLDTVTGQLQVYSSDNPQMKSTFNTLGRELGRQYPGREAPQNTFNIYQGPGQDPRDTMNQAMFAVKASGVGAFGYAT